MAIAADYATDMPEFWQKLQDLEFGQFWKELGQTLKDKEAMPLDLAGFDNSSNMQVADLRRRVKKLDFTSRLNTLNMNVLFKGKYDDWLDQTGADLSEIIAADMADAGGQGHSSELTEAMKAGDELMDPEVAQLLSNATLWQAFEKHAVAKDYGEINKMLKVDSEWARLLARALLGFSRQKPVKSKASSLRFRYNGTMQAAVRARGTFLQTILDKHFSGAVVRWPPQVADTVLDGCTAIHSDEKGFVAGMEKAMLALVGQR